MIFAGALLQHAENLLRMGLSSSEIIHGYNQALKKALDVLSSESAIDTILIYISVYLSSESALLYC